MLGASGYVGQELLRLLHGHPGDARGEHRRLLAPQGAALDRIAALNPALVVPGHQQPANGTTPASIAFTKEYLAAFDQSLAGATTPEQLQARIKAKYPDLALDIVLRIGSEAALARR